MSLGHLIGLPIPDLDVASVATGSFFLSPNLIRSVHGLNSVLVVCARLKFVQRLKDRILLHKNPAVEPPWESGEELVAHVGASWDCEDVIEFLKSALLGFRNPEEDHDECNDVGSCVEAEDTLRRTISLQKI